MLNVSCLSGQFLNRISGRFLKGNLKLMLYVCCLSGPDVQVGRMERFALPACQTRPPALLPFVRRTYLHQKVLHTSPKICPKNF